MPCKSMQEKQDMERPVARSNDFKSEFACILEASESTRMRMEESLPNFFMKTIVKEEDEPFTTELQFGTQIYFFASSNEDTRSKSSSG